MWIAAVRGLKTVSLMQKRQLTEVVSEIDPTVLLIRGQLWFLESIDFGVWWDLPISTLHQPKHADANLPRSGLLIHHFGNRHLTREASSFT